MVILSGRKKGSVNEICAENYPINWKLQMRTRLRLKELNTKRKKMMSFIFTHHTESEFSLSTYREAVKFHDFGELFITKRLYLIIFAVSIVFISVVYTDARATALTQITKISTSRNYVNLQIVFCSITIMCHSFLIRWYNLPLSEYNFSSCDCC